MLKPVQKYFGMVSVHLSYHLLTCLQIVRRLLPCNPAPHHVSTLAARRWLRELMHHGCDSLLLRRQFPRPLHATTPHLAPVTVRLDGGFGTGVGRVDAGTTSHGSPWSQGRRGLPRNEVRSCGAKATPVPLQSVVPFRLSVRAVPSQHHAALALAELL